MIRHACPVFRLERCLVQLVHKPRYCSHACIVAAAVQPLLHWHRQNRCMNLLSPPLPASLENIVMPSNNRGGTCDYLALDTSDQESKSVGPAVPMHHAKYPCKCCTQQKAQFSKPTSLPSSVFHSLSDTVGPREAAAAPAEFVFSASATGGSALGI